MSKLVHLISVFLVLLGGLHFALIGLGVNLLGIMFGGAHIELLNIVIGLSIIYHVMPVLKSRLSAL